MTHSNLKSAFNKGFEITFSNGYAISVQFGKGNYCANQHEEHLSPYSSHACFNGDGIRTSPNAEICIYSPDGEAMPVFGSDNRIKGYCDADEILKYMNMTANF